MLKNLLATIAFILLAHPLRAACTTSEEVLCILERFAVSVDWKTQGLQGKGHVAKTASDEWLKTEAAGNMWLFSSDNLEFLVKAVDACSFNGYWWLFYAATTDVEFELTVEDSMSGATNVYRNLSGHAAEPVQDTIAFRCAGHFTWATKPGVLVAGKLPPILIDFDEPNFGTLHWTPEGEITYISDPSPPGAIDNMWFHRRRSVGGQGNEVEVIEHRRLSILICDTCNPAAPADQKASLPGR